MSDTPDNPPAFPAFLPGSLNEHPGMSLRDYFAAQALPACLEQAFKLDASIGDISPVEWAVRVANRTAAAMLAHRALNGQPVRETV